MSKKSMWSISFSTPVLVLIPVAVGINYVGKLFAQLLKLPLWLDSIGTVIASMPFWSDCGFHIWSNQQHHLWTNHGSNFFRLRSYKCCYWSYRGYYGLQGTY